MGIELADNLRPTASTPTLLEVSGLTVTFRGAKLPAVRDVSFSLRAGETLGLVGESGSGKSTTSLALMGLLGTARVSGSVRLEGQELVGQSERRLVRVRGRKISMIFQDPVASLNPTLTIGEQLVETIRSHRGVSRKAAADQAVHWLDRVGIGKARQRLSSYPHEFSGGMCQRVMIAIALCGNPLVVVADEPTTALDVTVQEQILDLLASLKDELDTTFLVISHDLAVVADTADRVAVMYQGQIVEVQGVFDLFARPLHPYTQDLLAATPSLLGDRPTMAPPTGALGGPEPIGCSYRARCSYAIEECGVSDVPLYDTSTGRARCLRVSELNLQGVAPFEGRP